MAYLHDQIDEQPAAEQQALTQTGLLACICDVHKLSPSQVRHLPAIDLFQDIRMSALQVWQSQTSLKPHLRLRSLSAAAAVAVQNEMSMALNACRIGRLRKV